MRKTYKGYELVQAIAGGKIKEDTEFLAKCQVMYWDGNNIAYKSNPNMTLSLLQLANTEFVLLNEEIDIQEIEEYEFPSYADKLTPIENKLLELINVHTKAIKQLDRKVNESK